MSETPQDPRSMVIGPDGQDAPAAGEPDGAMAEALEGEDAGELTDLVESPAKVMRIGSMIKSLLEELKSSPVDEAGRERLASVLHTSITELKDGLAPELDAELDRLVQPFDAGAPSESELRIAHAQLVGWLEGLFHGIQTAIYAQQMAARAQLEQMRRALPPGAMPAPGAQHPGGEAGHEPGGQGGMYL